MIPIITKKTECNSYDAFIFFIGKLFSLLFTSYFFLINNPTATMSYD